MVALQELIVRGRFLFAGAPKRLDVFMSINGKRSTKEIAKKLGRRFTTVLQDIEKLKDMELICEKKGRDKRTIRKKRATVFVKTPLAKHIPLIYFKKIANTQLLTKQRRIRKGKTHTLSPIHTPSAQEILDIAKEGENQLYEFKRSGTKSSKITKEVAAFLHTKAGGIIFYGIEDDGSIIGSDLTRQNFDQKMHNSIQNSITPQPAVQIMERDVIGSKIIIIIIPPWDKKNLYQYNPSEKYYIRKGTNVFALKSGEIKKLSRGDFII